MPLNGTFWAPFFRDQCIKRIEYYIDTLENRILPTFANIDQESEKISNDKWEEYLSMPSDGSHDPSDFAEKAIDEGVEYYLIMFGQKQAFLNLSATVLYHLVEQHLLVFHRKQLLKTWEKQNLKLISTKELLKRLKIYHIDIRTFSSWDIVEEIGLVNNVVRHAEGASGGKLKQTRPDLFQSPELKGRLSSNNIPESGIYLPMAGEDIYVSLDDIEKYKTGLILFVEEFIYAICSV